MPIGKINRTYAYEVFPNEGGETRGGAVHEVRDLQEVLDGVFDALKINSAPTVDFKVDDSDPSRSHPIRDAAKSIAFEIGDPQSEADKLAARLSSFMDNRSRPALLMVSAHDLRVRYVRGLFMCTFPRQSFLRFELKRKRVKLNQVDSFSWESKLRKAAYLEGANNKSGMLSARVLDFQTTSLDGCVADFWGTKFLNSRPQLRGVHATRLLASALRSTYSRLKGDPEAQQQVTAAAISIHATPGKRRSIVSIATEYLNDHVAEAIIGSTPPGARSASFEIDQALLEELIHFRRFELNTGVIVLAPLFHVDSSSIIDLSSTNGKRHLRVSGEIEREEVRRSA